MGDNVASASRVGEGDFATVFGGSTDDDGSGSSGRRHPSPTQTQKIRHLQMEPRRPRPEALQADLRSGPEQLRPYVVGRPDQDQERVGSDADVPAVVSRG